MSCYYCPEQATAIKVEAERDFHDDGPDTITRVELPICGTCAELHYDGTEEFPGTLPLPTKEA